MTARMLAVLLTALAVPAMTLASQPPPAFDLAQLEKRLTASNLMQGQFRQLRWLADQEVRLHSQGRFQYQRDQQLIWLFESPTRQMLNFTPGQAAYDPSAEADGVKADIEALLPARGSFQRHLVDLMGGDFSALAEDYRLALSGDSEAWQVALHPRATPLELPLTTLNLAGGERLRRLEMTSANGDTLTIKLNDTEEMVDESLLAWLPTWTLLTNEPPAAGNEAMKQEGETGSEADAPRKETPPLNP